MSLSFQYLCRFKANFIGGLSPPVVSATGCARVPASYSVNKTSSLHLHTPSTVTLPAPVDAFNRPVACNLQVVRPYTWTLCGCSGKLLHQPCSVALNCPFIPAEFFEAFRCYQLANRKIHLHCATICAYPYTTTYNFGIDSSDSITANETKVSSIVSYDELSEMIFRSHLPWLPVFRL